MPRMVELMKPIFESPPHHAKKGKLFDQWQKAGTFDILSFFTKYPDTRLSEKWNLVNANKKAFGSQGEPYFGQINKAGKAHGFGRLVPKHGKWLWEGTFENGAAVNLRRIYED